MLVRFAKKLARRWACLALAAVFLIDLVLADPLPFLDEAVLAVLAAGCFRKHAKADAAVRGEVSG